MGLKPLSCKEMLRVLGLLSLKKRRLGGERVGKLIILYNFLKGGCKENRARFFSAVPSVRTTGNGHKLEQRRVPLNTK